MRKLFFILLLVISSNSFGGLFDNRLQTYTCNSVEQSQSCSGCVKIDFKKSNGDSDLKLENEFKIDKSTNTVIQITYKNGVVIFSSSLLGCKVVDNKNWICEDSDSYTDLNRDHYSSTSTNKMINGIFSHSLVTLVNGKEKSVSSECSK